MSDATRALDHIEWAERETPFCDCGAPTVAVERGGQVWLRCSAQAHQAHQATGPLRRLLTRDFGHTARPILDLAELDLEPAV